jgi:mono/diheme cytochrome c family protein
MRVVLTSRIAGLGLLFVASVAVAQGNPKWLPPQASGHTSLPAAVQTSAQMAGPSLPAAEQTALVKQYCTTCHNDRGKERAGNLTLAGFDADRVGQDPHLTETVEKMIRKLRAGMMPPAGMRRPEPAQIAAMVEALEKRIDRAAALDPNPGSRPSQRLNRAEYGRAVKDLLALDVDVAAYLPADTISDGFDNIADTQTISPTLMEGYLRAASQISRLAVGDRAASASSTTWKVARTASQMRHVDGAPLGTRGGLSVLHAFPADGDYIFKIMLHMGPTGDLFGGPYPGEQIDVSINGERVALLAINPRMNEQDPNGLTMQTPKIHVKAGQHRVSAAFVQRFEGPVDDLVMPIEHTLADTNIGEVFGTTALPHVRDFTVTGPVAVTGVSDTESRRRIFSCRPTEAMDESACAATIVRRLATVAYRGPVTTEDFKDLMGFYDRGRKQGSPRQSSQDGARSEAGDFESGVRLAVQAILASPRFLFRMEQGPPQGYGRPGAPAAAALKPGQSYRVSDLDLASRLSFFIWGSVPDAELIKVAMQGTLQTPAVFDRQLKRMLADDRSSAIATRFGSQWLRLQDVEKVRPDHHFYSYWDHTLSQALVRETELFFESLVREDRSVLDLLTADHTFVNERLAKHYGIPNIIGNEFRRVPLTDERRRGILGQGSILLQTSIADRTSPVLRGKWVMEVLLGSPPPPPPPNVPALEETKAASEGKLLSTRERMEEHRKNPACTSCHKVIDPLGLALENFDVTGVWRIKDNGVPIDPVGDLYDGTRLDGPVALRNALLRHQDVILLSFTESLMTYALGRRVESYDMPAIRAIVGDARRSNYSFSSLISGVAKSAAFRMSRVPPTETTVEGRDER